MAAAAGRLREAGVDAPRLDARLLMEHVLGCGPEVLVGRPEQPLPPAAAAAFEVLVGRRAAREPLSHITGRREFWGLSFAVGPQVLDPRPDSETLVASVLEHLGGAAPGGRILDLGTGSGCLLLALLSELPALSGVGVDISEAALRLARRNARTLGLAERAEFLCADWGMGLRGEFIAAVSNPPYIRGGDLAFLAPEVARYEPWLALSGGADGLDAYRHLSRHLPDLLADGAVAALEVGEGQAAAVENLMAAGGLRPLGRRKDLAGIDRCILFRKDAGVFRNDAGTGKKTIGKAVASD